MITESTLIEKREELKRRLTAGEYKTLVDVFLAWINHKIQKITHQTKPLPLWLMAVFFSLAIIFISFVALYIAGDLTKFRILADAFKLGYGLGLLLLIVFIFIDVATIIIINQSIHRIIVLWRDNILDSTESVPSLLRFQDWLEKVCN